MAHLLRRPVFSDALISTFRLPVIQLKTITVWLHTVLLARAL